MVLQEVQGASCHCETKIEEVMWLLPVQLDLRFQHELTPQHPAASGRRKPHTAEGGMSPKNRKQINSDRKESQIHMKKLAFMISAISDYETYLRVRHLVNTLIRHVHLEGVDT